MNSELPPLIEALLEPARYPHLTQTVELVQTHISWVLLAGDFAYKIKKPVKLSILDFSTLELRRQCCLDEVRLNQRYAPDLYLGVLEIRDTPQGPQWGGAGTVIEVAVKMRRFAAEAVLDQVCRRGALKAEQVSDLAESVVQFQQSAAVAAPTSNWGEPARILAAALDNFSGLGALSHRPKLQDRLNALHAWTQTLCAELAPILLQRKRSGMVRECHGDLHLGNLVLLDGRVRMFDCIEFSDSLRWIDVASEIAFTYVDLISHARPGLACWMLNEVWSHNGDYAAAQVFRWYAVYRAMVRAKVAALRLQQTGSDDQLALQYIALAEQLTQPPPLRLLICHGLSGCGKTLASSALLQSDTTATLVRLRSDVERKRLFGIASTAHDHAQNHPGLYAAEAHVRTYGHLHACTELLLRAGWSVVVDAAFLKRVDRDTFRALAQQRGAKFEILAPQATEAQLRERVRARNQLGLDASDADLAVLEAQLRSIEPLQADEIAIPFPVFSNSAP